MYTPRHFEEPRVEVLHDLIRRQPLGALVVLGSRGLVANHIPFHLSPDPSPLGTLRAHVSRANPVWKEFDPKNEALVIFSGPESYITPSWYATKRETGQAVPTWNYVVAHVHGPLKVTEEAAWLRAHVEELTRDQEDGSPEPWRVEDAPADYTARLLAGIVGLEIVVGRIEGKWKVSQNQPEANREGVIRGLEAKGDPQALAMAALVRERG
jgi:transcriptional regulator